MFAVMPLPRAEQRRRRETMLARVLLLAIDHVLFGEPLGLETACDLVREIKHADSPPQASLEPSKTVGCFRMLRLRFSFPPQHRDFLSTKSKRD